MNFLFKFLYSLMNFAFAVFFLFLGIICVLLPISSTVRTDFIEFVLVNSIAIGLFGFGLLIVGGILLVNLYLGTKRQYYYVRTDKQTIFVDEALILSYLNAYWMQLFPEQEVPTRLTLKKNKIKIMADLPYTPSAEQKPCVERIQKDLQDIFKRILGYSHEFMLSISFQAK